MKKTATILIIMTLIATFLCGCGTSDGTETQATATEVATEVKTEETQNVWTLECGVLISPKGHQYDIEGIDYNTPKLKDEYQDRAIIQNGTTLWLAEDSQQGITLTKFSNDEKVLDVTVAHDTVYWYTTERNVWCYDWREQELSAEPTLFYKNAIGVSPHTDEGEGAVVTKEEANAELYGLYLYCP